MSRAISHCHLQTSWAETKKFAVIIEKEGLQMPTGPNLPSLVIGGS